MICWTDPTLKEVEDRATHLQENSFAPSTNATRASQQRRYTNFCEDYGYDPLKPYPDQIIMYIAYLSFFLVYSSITGYISGLSHFLKTNGQPGIDYSNFKIKQALRGARRTCLKGRGRAKPLFPEQLLILFRSLNLLLLDDLTFWSALTLAFRALLRISNLCGKLHGLRFRDLSFKEGVLYLYVKSSKTNQFSEYLTRLVIVPNTNSVVCPVYWLRELIRLSNPVPESYVFRRLYKGSWRKMSQTWFSKKLKLLCKASGLGDGYSSHSLRRGGASHMSSLDFKLQEIKQRGCWSSDAVFKYIDESETYAKCIDVKFALSLP